MFRERDPQVSLWQSEFLVPPKKARRLERSWAEVFRNEALPLIDEERFAPMYCADNGRPNRAVQTVLGVHLLKEMFNLTDDESLEQLEFNLLWHHALRLDMEETHLPQKTLHNFRVRLMQHDGGRLAFQETTERIIQALGIRTGKQRLDSTHIMSNIATLTRLGLFCETMRLFLRAVSQEHPELRRVVPEGLVRRYLKEEAEATDYEDARSGEGRRRLGVCARDLYRLVDGFRGTAAAQLEEYRLLERLLREQCVVGNKRDGRPGEGDDDAGEGAVPITLRDPKEVRSDSLQSPHDPEATYSGHKGKGYEVQVAETCHAENATQLITHVEVTPSSGSDTDVTVPLVDGLAERKVRPDELFADTAYGSGRNAFEASRRGTELVSPVAGSAPGELPRRRGRRTAAAHWGGLPDRRHRGAGHGVPRRAPVRRGVRAGGCAGAGRGPLCQGNMRALPLAVPLPGEAGPACGGLRPQGGPGEGEHRGAAAGRGHRGVAQAVCHKGRDRGDKLRAEARPRAWALAGARGPSGAACRLPQGVGVQLQADGPCTPGGDGKHGSAGGRDGACGRSRVRAPLHNFHRAP